MVVYVLYYTNCATTTIPNAALLMYDLTVEFGADVPKREYDRFKRNFPQYGAVKWFLNEALRTFNDHVEAHPTSVDDIDAAIRHMADVSQQIRLATKGLPKTG
jgi:hypothetical protein